MTTIVRADPKTEARTFLFALYQGGGLHAGEWIELRCLDTRTRPAEPGPRRFYRSFTSLIDDAMVLRDRWGVFFGVGTRRCSDTHDMARCPHSKRGEDHVARLPAVWVDLDVKSADEPTKPYDTILDGLEALHFLPTPPTLIVASGAGLHAYWPFGEPTPDITRVTGINRRLTKRLHGDNAIDAARILRIPGTFNHKHGRPLPVRLLEAPEARV